VSSPLPHAPYTYPIPVNSPIDDLKAVPDKKLYSKHHGSGGRAFKVHQTGCPNLSLSGPRIGSAVTRTTRVWFQRTTRSTHQSLGNESHMHPHAYGPLRANKVQSSVIDLSVQIRTPRGLKSHTWGFECHGAANRNEKLERLPPSPTGCLERKC
jgi:hypothetical protein